MSASIVPAAVASPAAVSPASTPSVVSPKGRRQLSQAGSTPETPGRKFIKASDLVAEVSAGVDASAGDADDDVGAGVFHCITCFI